MISSIIFFPNIYFTCLQKSTWSNFLQNQIQTKQFNDIVFLCLSLAFSNFGLNQIWLLFFLFFFTKLINKKKKKTSLNKTINQINESCQNFENFLFSLEIYFLASTNTPGLNQGFLFLVSIQTVSKVIKSFGLRVPR